MADLPVGSTARSKYRFEAEHPTELSLEPGELVTILEPSRQDWTYCSRVSRPSEKGAAPSNYLEAATSASSRNPTGVVSSSRQQHNTNTSATNNSTAPSPLASSRGAPTPLNNNNPTNSRNNTNTNQNTSLMSTGTVTAGGSNRASPIPSATNNNNPNNNNSQHRRHNSQSSAALISMTPAQNALLEGFQKNELYFQQLLAQRQEVNANLDSALREAATEIDAAKDKHSAMERRLKELDNTINKERKRWKDRVEEERMLLAQRTGNAAPGNAVAPVVEYSTVTTTTTRPQPQPQPSTTNNTRAIGGGAAGASRYGGGR